MKIWQTLFVLGLSAFAIACAPPPEANAPEPTALASTAASVATKNGAVARFEGESPPWAAEATEIMAELEAWRGKAFATDVRVTFAPARADNLKGWYDSETRQLFVTAGESDRFGRGVLLHEIFHALQDQNFDLYQLHQDARTPEADRALRALIEGEAMLATSDLLDYDFAAHARLPEEGEVGEATLEKLYLYWKGLNFVRALKEAGGWEALDVAFRDPPRSTALIFNPDRYLAGEREVASLPLEPGEREIAALPMGGYGLWVLLARAPESRPLLAAAGEAFRADKLVRSTDEAGRVVQRWTLQFADPEVAAKIAEVAPFALAAAGEELADADITVAGGQVAIAW